MKLLETIRFEDGQFYNLEFHQKRMNDSRNILFDCDDNINLIEALRAWTPEADPNTNPGSSVHDWTHEKRKGLQKCRIKYAKEIIKIGFFPYTLSKIKSLKILIDNDIDYSFKYDNRSALNLLYKQRETCHDILIIKDGLITDTSYANILFFNGKEWITPSKPLLKGTQRARLLSEEKIRTADIRFEDLKYFTKARIINAMIRFEDEMEFSIENIIA